MLGPLATAFPVTNGNVYAFEVEASAVFRLRRNSTNDYADGQRYFATPTFFSSTSSDFDFGVVISPAPTIPTLSQWGLIVLALLFLLSTSRTSPKAPSPFPHHNISHPSS
jgi:hypothetical protein